MEDKIQATEVQNEDIAVIGMSGRFPGAKNLLEFWNNLILAKDCIKKFPESRRRELEQMLETCVDRDFTRGGYLDSITRFDHEFFAMSEEEARYMDPCDRLVFELVEEAILEASYNPKSLAGKAVSLFLAESGRDYTDLCGASPMSLVNNLHASIAGKIAYYYDFHGPAVLVDTACSSTLTAIHEACKSLLRKEADYAIAGGVNLSLFPVEKEDISRISILSENQSVRAFDEDAKGTVMGEGGGILVLKRLSKAIEDRDPIHAVIKGSAMNSDGRRSNGMVAPSQDGQAEVIERGIQDARIDPCSLSYIESHGTGTILGDPIEFAGISECLKKLGYKNQTVAMGSVKSNIGHLNYASGIANTIKVILMLEHKKIPASIHFESPNRLISFEDSPLYLNDQLAEWDCNQVRRAGVTSLGLIGTNVHLVLEESGQEKAKEYTNGQRVAILSALNQESLKKMVLNLREYLCQNQIPLSSIAATLNRGRRVLPEQLVLVANDTEDYIHQLDEYLHNGAGYHHVTEKKAKDMEAVLLIPDFQHFNPEDAKKLYDEEMCYRRIYDDTKKELAQSECDVSKKEYMISEYSYARLISCYGIKIKSVVGFGNGDLIADAIIGKRTLSELMQQIEVKEEKTIHYKVDKVQSFFEMIQKNGVTEFLTFGCDTALSGLFTKAIANLKDVVLQNVQMEHLTFAEFLANLVTYGVKVSWNEYRGQKVSLPGYAFHRQALYTKLSFQREIQVSEQEKTKTTTYLNQPVDIKQQLFALLQRVCVSENLSEETKMQELSFDSIQMMQFIGKVKEIYGIELPVGMFFEPITIQEFLTEIQGVIDEKSGKTETIKKQSKQEWYETSIAQKRMFFMYEMDPNDISYNIPMILKTEGYLDYKKLESALQKLMLRQESLRTSFDIVDGEVMQKVHDQVDFHITYKTMESIDSFKGLQGFVRPFQLSIAPLFRVEVITLNEQQSILMIDLHHIISDASSMAILISDLIRLYNGEEIAPLRIQYTDYAAWQNKYLASEEMKKQQKFWLDTYAGEIPLIHSPLDYIRPTKATHEGSSVMAEITKEQVSRLNQFSAQQNVTSFMTLLAVYNLLLARMTGQDDIVIGSPITIRKQTDLEPLIGMFLNTITFRNRPVLSKRFTEFLEEVKANALNVYKNQDYPFEELLNQLEIQREVNRNPVFDLFFNFINSKTQWMEQSRDNSIKIKQFESESITAKYDITLIMFEKEETIDIECSYKTKLFKQETIQYMISEFLRLLDEVIKAPEKELCEYDVFDRNRIHVVGNTVTLENEYVEFEDESIHQTIVNRFEEMVSKYPDHIAVKTHEIPVTYHKLNEVANQIAHKIGKEYDTREVLSKTEEERYKRQMLISDWGIESQEILKNTTVFVAGAGGSGSPIIYQLALCGIGTIIVCDHDTVELSNLNRQFLHDESRIGMNKALSAKMTVERINPNVKVIAYTERVDCSNIYEIAKDAAMIFDNVDDLETKFLISECAVKLGIPHIISSMIDINSYVAILHPPYSPCFHCLYDRSKLDEINDVKEYVKDYEKIPSPVASPALFVSAGFAVNEAIKILIGQESTAYNKYFYFNEKGSESIVDTLGYKTITYPFTQHFKNLCKENGFDWDKGWRGKFLEELEIRPDPNCPLCQKSQRSTKASNPKVSDYLVKHQHIQGVSKEENSEKEQFTCKDTVAVLLGHGTEMIEAMLGILKSGKIYVPLDPAYPKDRLEYMLGDSGARMVITDRLHSKQASELVNHTNRNIKVIVIEECDQEDNQNPKIARNPDQLAYILYTSGSTGKPKGVMQSNKNVLHFISCYTNNLKISEADRLTLFSSISFDASVMDIYGALLNGASLYPYSIKEDGGVDGIPELLRKEEITIYHSVPTVYRYFMNVLKEDERFDQVRLVVMGGEAVTSSDVELYHKHFAKNCIFINGLGPTESTVTLQYMMNQHSVVGRNSVPVGFPVHETQVYLLSGDHNEARIFGTGEIVYKSDYIALGYWNLPEKTKEVFVTDPVHGDGRVYRSGDLGRYLPDGSIEFIGRNDFQVKIRGYRIETGEIERMIDQVDGIKQSVVSMYQKDGQDTVLVAYYQTNPDHNITEEELKEILLQKLPDYMMPFYFVKLDEFPLTPTGKIDRKSLPIPTNENPMESIDQPPTTPTEIILYDIWKEVLKVDHISVYDNFFQIGGNSIRAVQVVARFKQYKLVLRDFYQYPTLLKMASYVDQQLEQEKLHATNEDNRVMKLDQKDQEPEPIDMMDDTAHLLHSEKVMKDIEPFNELFYKSCFYNAFFAVLKVYKKSLDPIFANELIVYKYDEKKDGIKFDVDYVPARETQGLLKEMNINLHTKAKCNNVIQDIINAINQEHFVILRIDAFYETIRKDTYQKLHWPHALLLYGYRYDQREFYVMEHSNINRLDYKPTMISFDDVVHAYQGYEDNFQRYVDTETFFEFSNTSIAEENVVKYDYIYYQNNCKMHREIFNESLRSLQLIRSDYEQIVTDEEQLKALNDELIVVIQNIIYAKKVEAYKIQQLCNDEDRKGMEDRLELLNQIISKWNYVKVVIDKYKYSSIYREKAIQTSVKRMEEIAVLEEKYNQ